MRVVNEVFETVSYANYMKPDFEMLDIAVERGFAESPDIKELEDPDDIEFD